MANKPGKMSRQQVLAQQIEPSAASASDATGGAEAAGGSVEFSDIGGDQSGNSQSSDAGPGAESPATVDGADSGRLLAELQERLANVEASAKAARDDADAATARAERLADELAALRVKAGDIAATTPPPQPQPKFVDPSWPVFEIEIEGCLLGKRYVAAPNEYEAHEGYKRPAGITSHVNPCNARPTGFLAGELPEGVVLFGV